MKAKPTLHDTLAFAHEMHKGMDDWTGDPYIAHPIAVMMLLPADSSEDDRHLALLHDVIEDCQERLIKHFGITKNGQNLHDLILAGFTNMNYSEYIIQGLDLLTRDRWTTQGMSYLDYIKNIVKSEHRGAMLVKLADNEHNTDPKRHARLPSGLKERSVQMTNRYERSKALLRKGLEEVNAEIC